MTYTPQLAEDQEAGANSPVGTLKQWHIGTPLLQRKERQSGGERKFRA